MVYVFFRLNQKGSQNEQHIQTWYSWSQYMLLWVENSLLRPLYLSEGLAIDDAVIILIESKPDSNAFINNNIHSTGTIPMIQVIYILMLHTVMVSQ